MDDFVIWVQAKIGPMTFGAILGFVLQVLIFRPKSWVLAAERAGAAIITAVLFSAPMMKFIDWLAPNLLDAETARTTSAALLALGGVELVKKVRSRFIKTVAGDTNE